MKQKCSDNKFQKFYLRLCCDKIYTGMQFCSALDLFVSGDFSVVLNGVSSKIEIFLAQ